MNATQFSLLMVDDEESIHEAFGFALRAAGYTVANAPNGETGFQMFLETPFDVVVTDRAMPRMTGEQLAQEIKNISPVTPIILITGHLPANTRVELFAEVLAKPFTFEALLEAVYRALPRLGDRPFPAPAERKATRFEVSSDSGRSGFHNMSDSQAGFHHRHRDKNGEISRKHGNTLVSTLRVIYGPGFAASFQPYDKLSDVLLTLDEPSLTQLVEDYEADRLKGKIETRGS